MNILLADDDEECVERISAILRPLGHQVASAGDGQQALEMLRSGGFDLLILDVMMPRMDGVEVLQALSQDPLERRVPIIMLVALTALVEENEKISAWLRGLGADATVPKYYMSPPELAEVVQRLTAQPPAFPSD